MYYYIYFFIKKYIHCRFRFTLYSRGRYFSLMGAFLKKRILLRRWEKKSDAIRFVKNTRRKLSPGENRGWVQLISLCILEKKTKKNSHYYNNYNSQCFDNLQNYYINKKSIFQYSEQNIFFLHLK